MQGYLGSRIGEGVTGAGRSVSRADGDKSHNGNSHLGSLSYPSDLTALAQVSIPFCLVFETRVSIFRKYLRRISVG